MTVRYITGRAGSGKSRLARQEIAADLAQGGEHRLILLVPEQFTLQAERDLLEQLQLPGIIRVEVLSFNRLAQRVLNEAGGRTRLLINEQGKYMVLKKIVDELSRDLHVYRSAVKQEGFLEEMAQLLASLKQHDLGPDFLASRESELEAGTAREKLHDIALIYQRFSDYMTGNYLDLEDQLNLFIEKMDASFFLMNARIWLDGFDFFTPQHLRIIEKIMLQAKDVTFCLTLDPKLGRDKELFHGSRYCQQQLQDLVLRHGLESVFIPLEKPGWENWPGSPALYHLERELYAYPGRAYTNEVGDIEIFAAANIYTEVEHIAASILTLVRDKNYRWRDITVLGNQLDNYSSIIRRVFTEYGIPCFMDEKREINDHPLIKLLLASMAVVNRGWRFDDLAQVMKSGFSNLHPDEAEELENYMLAYGMQGKLCQEEFTRGGSELGLEKLAALNTFRENFISPLQKLDRSIRGSKSCREISRAVYQYLQSLEVERKLADWTEQLQREGLYEYVHENAQIWNIVMETFDQMVKVLGDHEISPKEYARLLEAGYKSFSVGIIPTTIDQVSVGNILRSKSRAIKALFVLGINDGILPAGKSGEGLFTEEDKNLLKDVGIDWGSDAQRRAEEERYAIYMAFSKAAEFLSLSYAVADQEGKAMRPSLLLHQLRNIFPRLQNKSDLLKSPELEFEHIGTPGSSFKYLAENLRLHLDGAAIPDFWWDVYQWYAADSHWDKSRKDMLEALFYENQVGNMNPSTAASLYKIPFRASVSRLEQFVACPFAHFLRYGLRPQERKTFTVGAPDVGVLLHDCLAAFALTVAERKLDWRSLQQDDCNSLIEEIMDQKLPLHNNGVMISSFRYRYLAQRLKRISRRAIWVLTEHIQKGAFEPLLHEVRFGPDGVFPALQVSLNDGQNIYLEGRIDRIDILQEQGNSYIKIIDYKTGERQLSLADVYFGLSLQLFVYLAAVMNQPADETVNWRPAGLFYFTLDDPLIPSEDKDPGSIEEKIRKALKMKGLVLKDVQIVRSMDRDLQASSSIIPAGIKQNGEFTATSAALAEADFAAMLQYMQRLLQALGNEMRNGKILIEPVKKEQQKACDNCIYHAICQFDRLFAANQYRNIPKMTDAQVLEKIRVQQEGLQL